MVHARDNYWVRFYFLSMYFIIKSKTKPSKCLTNIIIIQTSYLMQEHKLSYILATPIFFMKKIKMAMSAVKFLCQLADTVGTHS